MSSFFVLTTTAPVEHTQNLTLSRITFVCFIAFWINSESFNSSKRSRRTECWISVKNQEHMYKRANLKEAKGRALPNPACTCLLGKGNLLKKIVQILKRKCTEKLSKMQKLRPRSKMKPIWIFKLLRDGNSFNFDWSFISQFC